MSKKISEASNIYLFNISLIPQIWITSICISTHEVMQSENLSTTNSSKPTNTSQASEARKAHQGEKMQI